MIFIIIFIIIWNIKIENGIRFTCGKKKREDSSPGKESVSDQNIEHESCESKGKSSG